jgi:hypothetical protein
MLRFLDWPGPPSPASVVATYRTLDTLLAVLADGAPCPRLPTDLRPRMTAKTGPVVLVVRRLSLAGHGPVVDALEILVSHRRHQEPFHKRSVV